MFVAECQPTVFMFPIIWEVFKKYCSVLMSVLQISYCVQNIHCMLEAQAPTEVENVESSLGCQSTAISKCCLKSGHTELAMSTVLFLLPTGVALHGSK